MKNEYAKRELLPNGLILSAATAEDLINFATAETPLELRLLELLREESAERVRLEDAADDAEDLQNQIAALERKQGELEDEIAAQEDVISDRDLEIRRLEEELDDVRAQRDDLQSELDKLSGGA